MLVRGAFKQSVVAARRAVFGVRFSFVKVPVPAFCRNKKEQPHALAKCSTLAWASEKGPMRSSVENNASWSAENDTELPSGIASKISTAVWFAVLTVVAIAAGTSIMPRPKVGAGAALSSVILSCGLCQGSWRRSECSRPHHPSLTDIEDTRVRLSASMGTLSCFPQPATAASSVPIVKRLSLVFLNC